MILVDASGLYAAVSSRQPEHAAARRALETDSGPFVLSPFVLAEVDYLLVKNEGLREALAVLAQVETGAYQLAPFDHHDVGQARRVIERYSDQQIGLTDASLVVLSGRLGTTRILTFDERHFRVLRAPNGQPFTVLPADAGP